MRVATVSNAINPGTKKMLFPAGVSREGILGNAKKDSADHGNWSKKSQLEQMIADQQIKIGEFYIKGL